MLFECTPRWLLARLERRGNVFPKGDFSNWVQQGIIYVFRETLYSHIWGCATSGPGVPLLVSASVGRISKGRQTQA